MKVVILLVILELFVNVSASKKCTKIRRIPARNSAGFTTEQYEVCCKGYALVREDCVPLCNTLCVNSVCTAPEFCTCNPGYDRIDDFRCERKCNSADCNLVTKKFEDESSYANDSDLEQGRTRRGIPDGITDFPESISTESDSSEDSSNRESTEQPDTSESSENWDTSKSSEEEDYGFVSTDEEKPPSECYNGKLVEDQCECNPGYYKKNDHCYSECTHLCGENGSCKDNKCSCYSGYQLVNRTCLPTCSNECINATCSAPNQCDCYEGFEFYPHSSRHTCRPKCNSGLGCTNGTCVAPEICECFEGFSHTTADRYSCQRMKPLPPPPGMEINVDYESEKESCNSTCSNGQCVEDRCECNSGYAMKDGNCVWNCSEFCGLNGDCDAASNMCNCHEGYKLVNGTCFPTCSNECVNATCVGQNECLCFEGFEFYPNTSTNVCRPKCDNEEGCTHVLPSLPSTSTRVSSNVPYIALYTILALLATAAIITALYIYTRNNRGAAYNVGKWEEKKRKGYTGKPGEEILIH